MTSLTLVSDNSDPKPVPEQGNDWHCSNCGCTILRGCIAGATVRKGELNLNATSCHISEEMRCDGCTRVVAMHTNDRWKLLT